MTTKTQPRKRGRVAGHEGKRIEVGPRVRVVCKCGNKTPFVPGKVYAAKLHQQHLDTVR